MAVRSYPFTGTYDSAFLRSVIHTLFADDGGIAVGIGNQLEVLPTSPVSMGVRVNTGAAIVGSDATGKALFEIPSGDPMVTLAVPSNATGSTRQDYVVIRVDVTAQNVTLVYKVGTTSVPALTRTSTMYEVALAQVSVANGAASIAAGSITDVRADTTLSGFLRPRGVINPVDIGHPISIGTSGNIIRIKDFNGSGAFSFGTVPAGKLWIIDRLIGMAGNPTLYYGAVANGNELFNFGANLSAEFPLQIVLPAGVTLNGSAAGAVNAKAIIIEVADPGDGRTWTKFQVMDNANLTLHSSKRFVATSVYTNTADQQPFLYDATLGSIYPYFYAPLEEHIDAGLGSGFPRVMGWSIQMGLSGAEGYGVRMLDKPFIVPPNRPVRAKVTSVDAGNYMNLFGYLEDSTDTVSNA